MTLDDLKKAIVRRLPKGPTTGSNEPKPIESDYDRRLRLSPEERYQDIKSQSYEHEECAYRKYLTLFNQVKADPFTHYETGEQRLAAYWKARTKAEELFKLKHPEGGCVTDHCIPSCRFYDKEGRIEDNELN